MVRIMQSPFGNVRAPRGNFESANRSVADAGAIGRAVQSAARTGRNVALHFKRARIQSELTGLETQVRKDVQDFQNELSQSDDPAQDEERFQEWMEGRQDAYRDSVSEETWSVFQSRLGDIERTATVKIQANSFKRQADQSRADMTRDLNTIADLYAQSDDPSERNAYVALARQSIAQRREDGFITAEQAVDEAYDFRDRLAVTRIRNDLLEDPSAVEVGLLSGEYEMSEDDRAVWLARAQSAAEREDAKAVAMADRQDRIDDREKRETQERTAKEALRLQANGQLSLDWILENEDRLASSKFKQLIEGVMEPAADDSQLVYELHARIDDGLDVGTEITDAQFQGRLTRTTADSLRSRNDKMFGRERPATPYKRADRYLADALKPSEFNPNPDARFAYANAAADLNEWFDNNPDADVNAAMAAAKEISGNYRLNRGQTMLSVSIPDWLVGGRFKPDFDTTESQIANDLQTGKITMEEADKRAQQVEYLRDIYSGKPNEPGQ